MRILRSASRTGLHRSASVAAIVLAGATPAFAQDSSGQTALPQAEDVATPTQQPDDEVVVVTGSRIARPEISSPNPITSFSAATLEQSGRTNLTDFLVQNPALIGSTTSADQSGSTGGFGATGTNLLNLRNLGTDRTLVLVDGRRHVAGLPGSASVDINTIPKDLLERVDVQTGGASAVYGADGVSGVVNFILKRNFEGVRVRGQAGISEDGDAGNRFASITVGKNFADGRGNVALSYEFTEDDRLNSFDRARGGDPLATFSLVRNPDDFPDSPTVFDRILLNNLRYADSSRDGAVDLDLDGIPDFTGTGAVYDRGRLLPSSGGLTQGGSSTPIAGYQGDLQPQNRVHNVNVISSFEFSDALRVYAQGKYARTDSYSVAQPSFDFFTYLAPDNAYLIERFGAAGAANGAFLSRDNFDLGVRGESTERETWRGVIGAEGRITGNARYDLSYTYGQTSSSFLSTNYRLTDRYFAALDAVRDPVSGQIVCRSTITGGNIDPNNFDGPATTFTPGAGSACRPLNLLGENVASQAALDFINVDLLNSYKVQQHVVSGSIAGDFGALFKLPGGPVGFAIGAEYRKEISDFVSDPFLQRGELADIAQIAPERGSFDVKEVFAELRAPLLSDLPFAHTLELNAAVRLSDYSTVGNTTTWAFSGIYAPVRDVRIRGTYSQAVRAPNITELFAPTNGTFSFIDDPCDPINLPEGTSFRAANCTATLAAAGLTPAQIAAFNPVNDPTATVSLPGRVGGNPNLAEETARTWTAGIVLQPSFLRGLTITADWYDIRLENAVRTATAQEVVDLCVDQPTLDNVYCQSVTRSGTTGYVSDYLVGPQNVAAFETAGLDLSVNYAFDAGGIGRFNVRLQGNYLDKLTFVPTPGADVENSKFTDFAPEYSGNFDLTWTKGPVTLNYGLTYFSKTRRYSEDQLRANPDIADPQYFWYREKWEHDLQASFAVNERFGFYFGVNNFTDEKGDVGRIAYPYSEIGRYFYAGARIALPGI
ncbi:MULTISPECIES: TonB-dependent receptor plug domain-containing protein [unclassified Sphingomonas]|uniref:TonB-dependent receptor plug domain-containing protein n=1 Tax=unclassified Sphingomonas TaxID=196159 RepID=UPI000AFD4F57|nr:MULTISPECIES: TonB-dependent receptor [unclassified Sphingomonas]